MFDHKDAKKGQNPQELVRMAKNQYPKLFNVWFRQVGQLNLNYSRKYIF